MQQNDIATHTCTDLAPNGTTRDYLNTRQAAKIANRTVATIRLWCIEGKVQSIQDPYSTNPRYLILKSSLMEYLEGSRASE